MEALVTEQAANDCVWRAVHYRGVENVTADTLSREFDVVPAGLELWSRSEQVPTLV